MVQPATARPATAHPATHGNLGASGAGTARASPVNLRAISAVAGGAQAADPSGDQPPEQDGPCRTPERDGVGRISLELLRSGARDDYQRAQPRRPPRPHERWAARRRLDAGLNRAETIFLMSGKD